MKLSSMRVNRLFGIMLIFGVVSMIASDAFAQRGRGGRGRGGGWGQSGNMALLNDSNVQKEIDLSDDQRKELEALQQKSQQAIQDMMSSLEGMSRDEMREAMGDMREKMNDRTKEMDAQIDEILLPHQIDRIKQLKFQSNGRRRGGAGGALGNEELQEALGLSEDQVTKLDEAMEETRKELAEEYAKLVEKHEKKLLDEVLTEDQKEKYLELVGEKFTFEERRRGGGAGNRRGGDRGDRGDRGGRRGRGGDQKKQRDDF